MSKPRLLIILTIILLSMILTGGVLAAAKSSYEQIASSPPTISNQRLSQFIEFSPAEADLEVTTTAEAGPVKPGDDASFSAMVINHSPIPASNVVFTSTLPVYPTNLKTNRVDDETGYVCGVVGLRDFVCTIDALGPAENFSIGFNLYLPNNAGAFTIHARATSDSVDPNPGNNMDSSAVLSITDFETHDCEVAYNPIDNCSFETNDFTGWITESVASPFYPLKIVPAGVTSNPGFFLSQPTNDYLAMVHGFGGTAGQYSLAQDLYLPPNSGDLRFDYRLAWDLISIAPADAEGRDFRVEVQPYGGGDALQETIVFSATADTWYNDTGNLTGRVNVSNFAGQPVRLKFIWNVPQSDTGPGFFQLDNIDMTQPSFNYSPPLLENTQHPNQVVTQTLTLYNMADGVLDWSLLEGQLPQTMRLSAEAEALADPHDTILILSGSSAVAESKSAVSTLEVLTASQTAPATNGTYLSVWQTLNSNPSNTSPVVQLAQQTAVAAILYDNGPIVTHPGAGSGSADVSAVQSNLGMENDGFGNQLLYNNRLADDFTVPSNAVWNVTELVFFGGQTDSAITSTFTSINYLIWDGIPGAAGSHVIYGNTYNNQLQSTSFSNVYRTDITDLTGTTFPVMQNHVSAGFYLPPGTYWIDWQADGTLPLGPWVSPITILGQTTTGNALQSANGGPWVPVVDDGTQTPQGLPFQLLGNIACNLSNHPNLILPVTSGSISSHSFVDVPVLFDSHALSDGSMASGQLCVLSTDPLNPVLEVPWEFNVINNKIILPAIMKK